MGLKHVQIMITETTYSTQKDVPFLFYLLDFAVLGLGATRELSKYSYPKIMECTTTPPLTTPPLQNCLFLAYFGKQPHHQNKAGISLKTICSAQNGVPYFQHWRTLGHQKNQRGGSQTFCVWDVCTGDLKPKSNIISIAVQHKHIS